MLAPIPEAEGKTIYHIIYKTKMKSLRLWLIIAAMGLASTSLKAQEIKNVIVMIPDGCSTEWLAFGRWMNQGLPLHLDAQIRGLVRTYCSDSPIGDSAPTGSTYATGHRSRDGYVATYPDRSMDELGRRFATDSAMAFRPMFTIMEAAQKKGMKTGEVFTCYFTHATPADFLAHTPNRNQYARICQQMVCQTPDLMLGGGSFYIDSALNLTGFDALSELEANGIAYVKDFSSVKKADRQGASKIWGLFAPQDMAFEIDRPEDQPSIAEMTRFALDFLSRSDSGFLLMVEGSKIDWGAHDNDIPASVHDFLAFDKAVGVALDFARQDGQTLVMVMPDHQTGGPTIGNYRSSNIYAEISVEDIFGKLSRYQKSVEQACREILDDSHWTDGSLEVRKGLIREALESDFLLADIPEETLENMAVCLEKKGFSDESTRALSAEINRQSYIGWTTHGHHGGDVFFATYHPDESRCLRGVIDNEEIAPYICQEVGLGNLDSLSLQYYRPIWEVFPDADIRIKGGDASKPGVDPEYAEVRLKGKTRRIRLFPNRDYCEVNGKRCPLPGICIYNGVDFYLPEARLWLE